MSLRPYVKILRGNVGGRMKGMPKAVGMTSIRLYIFLHRTVCSRCTLCLPFVSKYENENGIGTYRASRAV